MYVGLNSWTHELIDTQIIRISSFSITNEIMCMSVWFLDMWTFGHIANACTLLYIHRAYPNVYLNCWTHGLLATQYTLTYKFLRSVSYVWYVSLFKVLDTWTSGHTTKKLKCVCAQITGHMDLWTHNTHWHINLLSASYVLIYISVQRPGHLDTQQKTRILDFCNITEFGQKLSLFSFLDFSIFFIFGL